MKKITFILAVSAITLTATQTFAQDNAGATATERSPENIKKEADALKARIDQYVIKIEANKDNEKVDYEAEQVRIAEMKAKWEELTGKSWEREKLIEKM
ncbi:MAG: 2-hydroxyacyl-CoA dehydratase family protein [Flavobacteriales bacterium]|nr:2-hydroxyacyl-CoA dehydratase family protein [Flavobacteriales bacterium]